MSQIPNERRLRKRVPVMIVAEVSHARSGRVHARIRDISDSGVRLATSEILSAGTRVSVKLSRIGWIEARLPGSVRA